MQLHFTGLEAAGARAGAPHETLRLLGVIFRWLLVPLEAGFALWTMLLLIALAGWAVWSVSWVLRRIVVGARLLSAAVSGRA